jgi:DNA-directed RNA polymerase I, II, and III subunit RPABC5
MIIPVKCFTCGKVVGNKYHHYLEQVRKRKVEQKLDDSVMYLTSSNMKKTIEGNVMDELHLKSCCRRLFLTHVDLP